MRTKPFASVAATAAGAGILMLASCSSPAKNAAPAHSRGVSATAADSASAARPPGGAVHMIAYSINSDGPRFSAIVTGAVGDHGGGVTVYPNGKVDPGHTSQLSLRLTHGSFRLSIAGLDKKIVTAFRHWQGNAATCSGSLSVTDPALVVAGSGTGLYRGIKGSLTLTATIDEIDAKPCEGTGKFLWQVIVIAGQGTVSVG